MVTREADLSVDVTRRVASAAAPSPFHLHFTPTSASWLNLVERWLAECTNRTLSRSAHRSVTESEAAQRSRINDSGN